MREKREPSPQNSYAKQTRLLNQYEHMSELLIELLIINYIFQSPCFTYPGISKVSRSLQILS